MSSKEIIAAVIILILTLLITADIPSTEKQYKVKNKKTIDGDTIKVTGEISATVRLLGVDTPETQGPTNPEEFGLRDTLKKRECLKKWGKNAKEFTSNFTESEEILIKTDYIAGKRGDYGRLLGYIIKDSKNLGEELISKGYARAYETQFRRREAYEILEKRAIEEEVGLWKCT